MEVSPPRRLRGPPSGLAALRSEVRAEDVKDRPTGGKTEVRQDSAAGKKLGKRDPPPPPQQCCQPRPAHPATTSTHTPLLQQPWQMPAAPGGAPPGRTSPTPMQTAIRKVFMDAGQFPRGHCFMMRQTRQRRNEATNCAAPNGSRTVGNTARTHTPPSRSCAWRAAYCSKGPVCAASLVR